MPRQLIADPGAPLAPETRAGPIPQAAHLPRSAYKPALAQLELAMALVLQFRIFGDCALAPQRPPGWPSPTGASGRASQGARGRPVRPAPAPQIGTGVILPTCMCCAPAPDLSYAYAFPSAKPNRTAATAAGRCMYMRRWLEFCMRQASTCELRGRRCHEKR